jgi:hypothetical protein
MKRMIRQRKLNLGLFRFLTLAGVMVIACLMVSGGKVVEAGGGGGDVDYDHAPKLPYIDLSDTKCLAASTPASSIPYLQRVMKKQGGQRKRL